MNAATKAKVKLKKPPVLTARSQKLLGALHRQLKLPVLVYWTSTGGSICQNDVIAMSKLLGATKRQPKVALFLKSDGGNPEAALRFVHLLRQKFDQIALLAPFECASAATMVALGANAANTKRFQVVPPVPDHDHNITVYWTGEADLEIYQMILSNGLGDSMVFQHYYDDSIRLAAETYMILAALDMMGDHKAAEDGFHQWVFLPMQPRIEPGTKSVSPRGWDEDKHSGGSVPDRPVGNFTDGEGCLTLAEGSAGVGGHMDGVHAFGAGSIGWALVEHYRLTGDKEWFSAEAIPRCHKWRADRA